MTFLSALMIFFAGFVCGAVAMFVTLYRMARASQEIGQQAHQEALESQAREKADEVRELPVAGAKWYDWDEKEWH